MNDEFRELPLPLQLIRRSEISPHAVALRQKESGIWKPVTWAEYASSARHFGLGLLKLGLAPGQALAILSENRKEWLFAQMGASLVRAIAAGIYPTSPAGEVAYLLALCEAPVVVVEDQEQLDKVIAVRDRLPALRAIVVIDPRGLRHYSRFELHLFSDVVKLGAASARDSSPTARPATPGIARDDIGLMVFTSGSTGRPKAALMSWRGLGTAAQGLNSVLECSARDNILSYLPLCHVAEQMFSLHVPVATGAVVNFAESLRTVQEDLREISPQVFFGVPRIWEKFHAGIQTQLRGTGRLRRWLFEVAYARSSTTRSGLLARFERSLWYWLVMRALCNFIGMRRCRVAYSAGAPIAPEILRFFRHLGVPVRELYGLTESSGAIALQRSDASPIGCVGMPYPNIEVQLAPDGEILIRGDIVFRGYFKNQDATAEAIDALGWLHTGDVGAWIDGPVGQELKIIDRKKDIMITAGGKNITPSEIENALRASLYIKEAIVIADRRRFVAALIQIDFDSVSFWVEQQGLAYTNFRSLVEMSSVRDLIQKEINRANSQMPQVQHVRKFHLLTKELDHDDGEVTATMKVRRKSVAERYADAIEAMYA